MLGRPQESRLKAIQSLAEARQHIVDVREETERERAELETRIAVRINDAERGDLRAYNAALTAGWTDTELRKIGFPDLSWLTGHAFRGRQVADLR